MENNTENEVGPSNSSQEENNTFFDEYGFAVFQSGSISAHCDERYHVYSNSKVPPGVITEWDKVFRKWMQYKNGLGIKLRSLTKKGVPQSVRFKLWKKLLDVDILKSSTSTEFCYKDYVNCLREQLVKLGITEYNTMRAERDLARLEMEGSVQPDNTPLEPEIQSLRQIFLDVARTFPTHKFFYGNSPRAIEGRAALSRVLGIYRKFDPTVGYCQGMSFIAGMLILNMPEEEAFWCLVSLLQKPKYFQGYYDVSLERVQRHASVFDRLLKQRQPDLWMHLNSHNLHPLMYITPWFMCLFTSLPCWDCVLEIWDLLLLEGCTVVFQVALAIMEVQKSALMAEDDGNALIVLLQKLSPKSVNRDTLLPVIWKTPVHWWEIERMHALIDEEQYSETGEILEATKGQDKATLTWRRMKQKLMIQRVPGQERSILKKFARMFNGRQVQSAMPTMPMKQLVPDIVVIPPTPDVKPVQKSKTKPRLLKKVALHNDSCNNSDSLESQQTRQRSRSNQTDSIPEDVSRINRLATGKKGQSRSTDRLEEVIASLVGSAASQQLAFEEFAHPIPLHDSQNLNHSLYHSSVGSLENELESILDNSISNSSPSHNTALKRRRVSGTRSNKKEFTPCRPAKLKCTSTNALLAFGMHESSKMKTNQSFNKSWVS